MLVVAVMDDAAIYVTQAVDGITAFSVISGDDLVQVEMTGAQREALRQALEDQDDVCAS